MLRHVPGALVLVLACNALHGVATAQTELPELPEQFSMQPMARHIRVNGLPMEIQLVTSSLSPALACARIGALWTRTGRVPSLACRSSGEWTLASVYRGSREWTVQLRKAAAGSRGYLSSVDLSVPPSPPPSPRVPLPSGARVRTVLQSTGSDGETLQYTVGLPGSPAIALGRLADRARRLGWEMHAQSFASSRGGPIEWRRGRVAAHGFLATDGPGSGLLLVESPEGAP